MKIITWNMGYWQFRQHHEDAWAYLRNEIRPDLALLQEVRPPDLIDGEAIVFREVHQGWGTAVYSRQAALNELLLGDEYPNRSAGATTPLANGQQLYVASIHAPIIKGRVFPHLAKIVDEVEATFEGQTAVIGGDLNSARLAESVWPGNGHGPFFERIDSGPFVDCCQRVNGKELQTYFRDDAVHPFQDDHLFVSRSLADAITTCDVIESPETRQVSDHIPLMLELAL